MTSTASPAASRHRTRQNGMHPALLWAGVVACLPFIYVSAAGVRAGISDFKARAYIETWSHLTLTEGIQGKEFIPAGTDLETAYQQARLATNLSPRNPDFQITLGDTLYWGLKGKPHAGPSAPPLLQAYRTSIRMRPTWPDSHLRLAKAKILVGEFDAEMVAALRNTRMYGPWKPNLMYDLVETGLWHWPRLNEEARSIVMETIESAQRWQLSEKMNIRHSVAIWNLVVAFERKPEICARLDRSNPRNIQFCQFKAPPAPMPVGAHK